MASLLDSLTELVTPDMASRVAGTLGESDATVTRGLRAAIPTVLSGLMNRTGDSGTMSRVYEMATSREHDPGTLGDVAGNITRSMTGGSRTGGIADALLSTLFGGRGGDVGALVGRTAGFSKPSSGSTILSAVAPMVLGFLGKQVRDRSLDVSQFTNLLASQRDTVLDAAPAGLRNLLDTEPAARVGGPGYNREATYVPPPRTPAREERGGGWLWPLLGGAAVLALLWALLGRDRTPETVARVPDTTVRAPAARVDSPLAAASRTVDTAAGTVAGAMGDSGGTVEPPTALQGTSWRLEEIDGRGVLDQVEATLQFTDSARVAGNGSCNRFFGSVSISGDSIAFSQMGTTMMACPDEISAQESSYLKALEQAERFERNGPTLLIYSRGLERPLRFRSAG